MRTKPLYPSLPTSRAAQISLNPSVNPSTDELGASLHGVAHIALGLHERFDLKHPAQLSSQQTGQSERVLPDGTTIVDAYDQAGNGLLMLGEPGAGKSTLLYNLAQALLTRAEQDETYPLPVILNLSSWAEKRLLLETWLVEELQLRYLIPRQLSQRWEQQVKLLPLLDGLDEVAVSARDACIKAINTYHSGCLVPLVVCSRREEYQAASERLMLQSAVIVQPLTSEQIKAYLKDLGRHFAAVRKVVDTNRVLQELLTTPLMLSVVMLTYKDKAVKDLPQLGTPEQQQQQIFERYIERMLGQRTIREHFTSQQIRHWLTWLAQQMQQRHLSEFYLERLQPTWLSTKPMQIIYTLLVGLVFGLIFGLLGGLASVLIGGLENVLRGMLIGVLIGVLSFALGFRLRVRMRYALVGGLVLGLVDGLVLGLVGELVLGLVVGLTGGLATGLVVGLTGVLSGGLDRKSLQMRSTEVLARSWEKFLHGLVVGLAGGLIVGLATGLVVGGLADDQSGGLIVGLATGLATGLVGGLGLGIGGGLVSRLIGGLDKKNLEIHPAEVLAWSWKKSWQGLFFGLAGSLIFGLIFGLSFGQNFGQNFGLIVGLIFGLVGVLIFGSLSWLSGGVSGVQITEHLHIKPNQGIRSSGRNALLIGFMIILLSGLVGGLIFGLVYELVYGLVGGLIFGLFLGLVYGLYYGGAAYFEHYLLRFLLCQSGAMPWYYVRFLEDACKHILLQRVGGGYRFIHPLFLNYFASEQQQQQQSSPHS